MSIIGTVEEVQSFLEAETTVTLLTDEPSKFMVELKNLLDGLTSAAEDIDSAIDEAISSIEEARSRAEDAASEAENAVSELEYVR